MSKANIIAYIDDDLDDLELLQQAFAPVEEWQLKTFSHPDEFTRFIAREVKAICLLMLDINMPLRNGVEMAFILKQEPELSHLPVMLFSTSPRQHATVAIDSEWHYVKKPTGLKELESVVQTILHICKATGKKENH